MTVNDGPHRCPDCGKWLGGATRCTECGWPAKTPDRCPDCGKKLYGASRCTECGWPESENYSH